MEYMPFTPYSSSVPFCDPHLPHSHSNQSCSLLPHRACYPKGQQQQTAMSHQATQGIRLSSAPSTGRAVSMHRLERRQDICPHGIMTPPPSPLLNRTRSNTHRSDDSAISGIQLNDLRQDSVIMEQREEPTMAGAEQSPQSFRNAASNRSLRGSPNIRFTMPRRADHCRMPSAPVSSFNQPRNSDYRPRGIRPRAATLALAPLDGTMYCRRESSSHDRSQSLQPSAPIYALETPPSCRVRESRPPAQLRLFPNSPTNSMESKSRSPPVSSPTTSIRPSLYLQQQVSVFEDDDEKMGLMDYLRWPLQHSRRTGRRLSKRQYDKHWKGLLCLPCASDEE